jgi:phytanoyl-CoA hydroxylase
MLAKVSWHQDNGVILPEADATDLLTVWLPLTEATEANGCLAVLPGSHKLGLLQHCQASKDVAIPDELLPPIPPRPLPMKPGDVLLMSKLMVHSSLDNVTTSEVRISADLRYQPVGQPIGRPAFAEAGFIARSQAHPDRVLSDPATWAENWYKLRDQLAAQKDAAYYRTNRWLPGGVCA